MVNVIILMSTILFFCLKFRLKKQQDPQNTYQQQLTIEQKLKKFLRESRMN